MNKVMLYKMQSTKCKECRYGHSPQKNGRWLCSASIDELETLHMSDFPYVWNNHYRAESCKGQFYERNSAKS